MGRSKTSCLKIITCSGGDATDAEDLAPEENKASPDKRRWSFRKRSTRHRVLSNSVISEPVSAGYNKESLEVTTSSVQSPKYSGLTEKTPIEEKVNESLPPPPPAVVNTEVANPPASSGNTTAIDYGPHESVIIVIQAATRGSLARREIRKLKSVVKLQATVRGYLVRRQAIGTLLCVQAIIKMQALVRARYACQFTDKSAPQQDRNFQMDSHGSTAVEESSAKLIGTHSLSQKLLSNGFARQLLETTPKSRPVQVKCDPSKSDSTWIWLERWTSVSASDEGQQAEQNLKQGHQEQEETARLAYYEAENEVTPVVTSEVLDIKLGPTDLGVPGEGEVDSTTQNIGGVEIQAENEVTPVVTSEVLDTKLDPTDLGVPGEGEVVSTTQNIGVVENQAPLSVSDNSLVKDDLENPQLENEDLGVMQETCSKFERNDQQTSDSPSGEKQLQTDPAAQMVLISTPDKPESDSNGLSSTTERSTSEPVETEGKEIALGLKKPCNPAFAAAQSKFEEMSSASAVSRSSSSSHLNAPSKSDSVPFQGDDSAKSKGMNLSESSLSHDPRVQLAASECGTEISVSSTLDSPDRSETGGEIVLEIGALEKGNYDTNNDAPTDRNPVDVDATNDPYPVVVDATNDPNLADVNVKGDPNPLDANAITKDSFIPEVLQPQRLEQGDGNLVCSTAAADAAQVEQLPATAGPTTSDMQTPMKSSVDSHVRSSPEGTPRSRMTAPESHGTPSSQTSVNAKKRRKDNSTPTQKQRSQITSRRSSATSKNDSGGRSSTERLPKDSKNVKRRTSLGLTKADHGDNEPRHSSSSSLPSYMQATESARAKVHATISPKLSPDAEDNHVKKRHSLPIGNGKQGSSPRMQRSASQVQQNLKGNCSHSPHDSAERRWQR